MSQHNECNNNLFFLALSKNKATIYEYNAKFSTTIIEDIEKELKKNEANNNNANNNNNLNNSLNNSLNNNNVVKNDTIPMSPYKSTNGIIGSYNPLRKSTNKMNIDFLINRGITIFKEYEDVELATCTNDYKKLILVKKSNLNIVEIIDIKNDKGITYIKTKTPIKRVITSPKDTHIVIHCQYKPDIANTNLYIYKFSNKSAKKKKTKQKKDNESGKIECEVEEEDEEEEKEKTKENIVEKAKENIVEKTKENIVEKAKENIVEKTKENIVEKAKENIVEKAKENIVEKIQENNKHNLNDNKSHEFVQKFNSNDLKYNDSVILELTLKSYSNKNWPFFKWTESESMCTYLLNNKIYIYKDNNFNLATYKIELNNLEYFDISPENNKKEFFICTYEQSHKGSEPSVFKIFRINDLKKEIYYKSFFNCDEIKLKWNKTGTALLLQIHTQVDKEKQSYYGSSNLYFIDMLTLKDVNIMTSRGLIYDNIWSNNQNKFFVCKGEIPAEIVLYDKTGNVLHSYGSHKFNTLKLNNNEKLLLTGGFGNLSGDISIWNTSNKKEIAKTKSSCAVICEFFNDGLHFLTATTHPRLRVDNNIKIYKYNGLIVSILSFNELYNVMILPFHKIKFQETDATINLNMKDTNLQLYINKQLGIDPLKKGVYRAPRSITSLNATYNISGNVEKKKTNMPPGSNFVVEEKTQKKKKKKKKNDKNEKTEMNDNGEKRGTHA
ncbi:eukaryotic translation initiation factor eIF2A, putative [Hepatocystis sp. ex Piliocolobus tephrosceles]|nr:eukaryotic translation initiation factor eIF2A, putative [Hepatocystis sp. ex Piliocolobus tephrosceles]